MTRVKHRFVGERKELATYGGDKLLVVAAPKVRAPDTSCEQGISHHHKAVRSTVESHAPGGMARDMEHRELGTSESNGLASRKRLHDGDIPKISPQTECPSLLACRRQLLNVQRMCAGRQTVGVGHKRIAEDMIQMQVSAQEMFYCQSVFRDKVCQHLFFRRAAAAAVDDDCLARLVVEHKGVFAEIIEHEFLYRYHKGT